MVIVHSQKDLAMIRKRANEGDWSRGEREIAAPMGTPTRLHGLLLGGAIDYAHIGSTIDESGAADRDLGLAIFATHQQMRPVVARWQRRRDERAVVERGFFIGDDPRRIAARSALAQPLPRRAPLAEITWNKQRRFLTRAPLTKVKKMAPGPASRCFSNSTFGLVATESWSLHAPEILLRFDVARSPHQNESGLIAPATWQEALSK